MSKVNFKIEYDFSTNKGRNKYKFFLWYFDWKIIFLYYFHDSWSPLRSKSQFQGKLNKNMIFNK